MFVRFKKESHLPSPTEPSHSHYHIRDLILKLSNLVAHTKTLFKRYLIFFLLLVSYNYALLLEALLCTQFPSHLGTSFQGNGRGDEGTPKRDPKKIAQQIDPPVRSLTVNHYFSKIYASSLQLE